MKNKTTFNRFLTQRVNKTNRPPKNIKFAERLRRWRRRRRRLSQWWRHVNDDGSVRQHDDDRYAGGDVDIRLIFPLLSEALKLHWDVQVGGGCRSFFVRVVVLCGKRCASYVQDIAKWMLVHSFRVLVHVCLTLSCIPRPRVSPPRRFADFINVCSITKSQERPTQSLFDLRMVWLPRTNCSCSVW